jgi:hypothetical protein
MGSTGVRPSSRATTSLFGLKNAPVEVHDTLQLITFLSQVAPVDFHPDLSAFRQKIFEEAALITPPAPDRAVFFDALINPPAASERLSARIRGA